MGIRIAAYHRTEPLRDGTFIAQVHILSAPESEIVETRLRDDEHPCATREEAESREVQLAEWWKRENAPADATIDFCK